MSRIALNLRRLASREEGEKREVEADLRELTVLRTPVAQRLRISEAVGSETDGSCALEGPVPPPSSAVFPSRRVGLAVAGGMGRSSVLFLVAIALAVATMSAIALAIIVPSSEWAFLGD